MGIYKLIIEMITIISIIMQNIIDTTSSNSYNHKKLCINSKRIIIMIILIYNLMQIIEWNKIDTMNNNLSNKKIMITIAFNYQNATSVIVAIEWNMMLILLIVQHY